MIQIEQGSFAAMTAEGQSSEISAADSAMIGLVLNNDGTEDTTAQVQFMLSDGQYFAESIPVYAQSQQWASWNVGALAAGTYTCSATVTAEPDGEAIGQDETYFEVTGAQSSAGGGGGGYQHDPNDYRLEVGEIRMQTEGGTIVHAEDEAFATEQVHYYAEVLNSSNQFLGPFEVHFLVDGEPIGWGGMSHEGVLAGDSFWAQGFTDPPLSTGAHTLSIKIESSDPSLFVGSEQEYPLTVLEPRSQGSVAEGDEADLPGWIPRDLNLWVKDYQGRGVNGNVYVEINGGGHRVAKSGVIEDGAVNISGSVRAPTNEGSLLLTVDTAEGRQLSGGGTFDDGEDAITKTYVESKRVETQTFERQEDWQAMVGATASAGVQFTVFSAGVEVTGEYSWGETITQGREYEIWIAQGNLEDEERQSARQR